MGRFTRDTFHIAASVHADLLPITVVPRGAVVELIESAGQQVAARVLQTPNVSLPHDFTHSEMIIRFEKSSYAIPLL